MIATVLIAWIFAASASEGFGALVPNVRVNPSGTVSQYEVNPVIKERRWQTYEFLVAKDGGVLTKDFNELLYAGEDDKNLYGKHEQQIYRLPKTSGAINDKGKIKSKKTKGDTLKGSKQLDTGLSNEVESP